MKRVHELQNGRADPPAVVGGAGTELAEAAAAGTQFLTLADDLVPLSQEGPVGRRRLIGEPRFEVWRSLGNAHAVVLGPGLTPRAVVVESEVLEHPLARLDVTRDQILVYLNGRVTAGSRLNT